MEDLTILLHDGKQLTASVPEYKVADILAEVNNHITIAIGIGDIILHKNSIKLIAPSKSFLLPEEQKISE